MLWVLFMCVGVYLYGSLISYSVAECTSSLHLHLLSLTHTHGEHTCLSLLVQIKSDQR